MKIGIAIPVRLGSERLPNKPLVDLMGLPMIRHVWERAKLSKKADEVVIVTPDIEIQHLMEPLGANVILSKKQHMSGTSRIEEISRNLNWDKFLILQGDEPLIIPNSLDLMIKKLSVPEIKFVNSISPLKSSKELDDESIVKCTLNHNNSIIFMYRKNPFVNYLKFFRSISYKVNGLYGMSADILHNWSNMKNCIVERTQSIEQIRLIFNGHVIDTLELTETYPSINIEIDIKKVLTVMKNDKDQQNIMSKYV